MMVATESLIKIVFLPATTPAPWCPKFTMEQHIFITKRKRTFAFSTSTKSLNLWASLFPFNSSYLRHHAPTSNMNQNIFSLILFIVLISGNYFVINSNGSFCDDWKHVRRKRNVPCIIFSLVLILYFSRIVRGGGKSTKKLVGFNHLSLNWGINWNMSHAFMKTPLTLHCSEIFSPRRRAVSRGCLLS